MYLQLQDTILCLFSGTHTHTHALTFWGVFAHFYTNILQNHGVNVIGPLGKCFKLLKISQQYISLVTI